MIEYSEADLNLITERLTSRFTEDQLQQLNLLDRPMDADFRRELAALDLKFFKKFYLSNHFSKPGAEMHAELNDYFENIVRSEGQTFDVVAWPRGFGKTTHVDLGAVAWCICFEEQIGRHYILLIASSYDQSKAYLLSLKEELLYNERIKEDFGDLKGSRWQEGEIITSTGVMVRALGARMKIRGRKFKQFRPDLVIGDDLESIESVTSEVTRERDAEWLARSVLKAGNPDRCAFIFIGTLLHYDSVLARLLKNPMFRGKKYKAITQWAHREDLWDTWRGLLTNLDDPSRALTARQFYNQNKVEMDKGAESAWPEGFSYYNLMLIMVTGEGLTEGSSFWAEMQNEPLDPSEKLFSKWGLFRSEWRPDVGVVLAPLSGRAAVPLSACAVFGSIDPSLGEHGPRRDPCAISVVAKAPTGQMFSLESIIDWLTPDRMISKMIELGQRYNFTQFGVESVQFQALFASDAARESAAKGVYLPVTPVPQRANKLLRIQSLEPDLTNEYLLLPADGQEELKRQLDQAPKAKHDDGPDGLEIAVRLAKRYQGGTVTSTIEVETHEFGESAAQKVLARETDPYAGLERAALEEENKQRAEQGLPTRDVDEELWYPIIVS